MTYSIREIYYTLQGEGARTGRPAVFLRFSGCNLWSGREQHRAEAVCRFCDTEFVGTGGPGGGKFESAAELADAVANAWPAGDAHRNRYVVCTGGEPLLQLDAAEPPIADRHVQPGDRLVIGPGEMLKRGRMLYAEHCQHCHGVSGDGKGISVLLPTGEKQQVVDSPAWIGVAEMLVRRL